MKYVLKIRSVEIEKSLDNLKDVIDIVEWEYIGISDRGTIFNHVVRTEIPSPSTENFKPYEKVTRDDVIEWIKQKFTSEDFTELEAYIFKEIEAKENPTRIVKQNPFG